LANPTYEQTSSGKTGHFEAIQITYDSKKITFKELLKVFWKNIDPYDTKGQFCDKGEVYKSAVFTANEDQAKAYQESIIELEKEGLKKGNIATQLLPLKPFYKAEEYHQNYYLKNPVRYKFYRYNCGRDQRLKEVWGLSPTSKQN
jgi:peptide-methionine (S)-S-oxide reductase